VHEWTGNGGGGDECVWVHRYTTRKQSDTRPHQSAGHTSPCSATNWNAVMRRRVSSTDRPTGRLFMVICCSTPCDSGPALVS